MTGKMLTDITFRVTEHSHGTRLDAFLAEKCGGSTKKFIRMAIEEGRILVNGLETGKGMKLSCGDAVYVQRLLEAEDNRVFPDPGIIPKIVYEDGFLLGADKPSGIAVQPLSPDETGTLAGGMVNLFPCLAHVGDEPLIAGALHRIDRGTSGLVLFAKDNATFKKMRDSFSGLLVRKRYLALVEGLVAKPGSVASELVHDPKKSFCRMIPARKESKGRRYKAATDFRPLWSKGGATLLEVSIRTGVTHQIRAHLAISGHPIVGDALYGSMLQLPGGAFRLHSLDAQFPHPATGRGAIIKTDEPEWAQIT